MLGSNEVHWLPILLLALIFILFVVPIASSLPFAEGLLRLGLTAVLVFAAMATERRRIILVAGLIVVGIAAPLSWITMIVDQPSLFICSCLLNAFVFAAAAVMILVAVIRKHLATVHSIYGAISAYLLLGLAWAIVYWGLHHVDDQALRIATPKSTSQVPDEDVSELAQFVYFSFVTMSTLGYGDITPRTTLAQTITWMQSVCGQFYIAVLVAWLVSEIPRRRVTAE